MEVLLVFSQIGFCMAYLIFVGDNIYTIVPELRPSSTILLCLPLLFLLTQIRRLHLMAPISMAVNVFFVFAIAVVMSEVLQRVGSQESLRLEHKLDTPIFFGMAVYKFEGIGLAVPIQNAMQMPESFKSVWIGMLACLTVFFILFGTLGYAAYGDHIRPVVTLELTHSPVMVVVKLCLCVALILTYVLMLYPVFEVLENNWLVRLLHCGSMELLEWRRSAIRFAVVGVMVLGTLLIPNFGYLISLVGSVGCNALAFILPAAFHIRILSSGQPRWVFYKNVAIIVFGLIAMVICTMTTLIRIMDSGGKGATSSHRL